MGSLRARFFPRSGAHLLAAPERYCAGDVGRERGDRAPSLRGAFFEDWFSTFPFDEWEQDLDDVIECGDQAVVALTRQRGRGSASGANVELEYAQVVNFREGKIVRVVVYTDREQALEAAGLSE